MTLSNLLLLRLCITLGIVVGATKETGRVSAWVVQREVPAEGFRRRKVLDVHAIASGTVTLVVHLMSRHVGWLCHLVVVLAT